MNLDDLKDSITNRLGQLWERTQESSFYNQIKDRYEGLSSAAQKATLLGLFLFFMTIILMTPWTNWLNSTESVEKFETRRNLIRDLFKISRQASNVPDLPVPAPVQIIRGEIEGRLNESNLLPEQIKAIEVTAPTDSALVPKSLITGGVNITLLKLNLRQIVDIGHKLQSLHPSVKVKDLHVTANQSDGKYFDVIFKLIALNVPDMTAPPPPIEEDAKDNKKTSKTPSKRTGRQSEDN